MNWRPAACVVPGVAMASPAATLSAREPARETHSIKRLSFHRALPALPLAALVANFLLAGPSLAQEPPSPLPAEQLNWHGDPAAPNMSGVWVRAEDQGYRPGVSKEGWAPWPAPLKGAFLASWRKRVADAAAGKPWGDPVVGCVAPGMPRFIAAATTPLLIMQSYQRVTMYRDGDTVRRIWLDGRTYPAPADLEPFPKGTSIGSYEGQDLVVEGRGFKDMPLDSTGLPHSDQMRIVERYHRADAQTLTVQITVTDPEALSRPITSSVTYKALNDPLWEPKEFICKPKTDYHPERYIH
jgi:hypothetical protein